MTEQLTTLKETWVIDVTRDLTEAKQILTKVQYLMFKPKSDVLFNHLKGRFPRKERLDMKNGFYVLMEGSPTECKRAIDDLEKFLLGNEVNDTIINQVKNDRLFKRVLDKMKRFKTSMYNSLMKDTTPLSVFNQCGIMVRWYKKK